MVTDRGMSALYRTEPGELETHADTQHKCTTVRGKDKAEKP